ncbi:uncharacterized protein [Zea mays]|jgi:hypothetical protein|uniref:Uncharacterized protein n=1 Tax=Zea mays TaxID=4577 RepID=A0A1D6F123_MAIZE|nr:uncharacterized protein LOC100277291 [Zea mays]ONM25171.1 hypothetical protein ZEAMMB73_Zm00001d006815 [Zea mays]|eukprot:XP_008670555.1 uncharacterized protein LOC100277291 [Zea mays]
MAFPGTPARKIVPGGFTAARTAVASGGALSFDLDGADDFFWGLWQLVKAKAAEAAAYLAALFAALAEKADEIFPPETRSETLRQWMRVAVSVVIPALVVALVLCCCCCACRRARGGRRARFMAAPGRGGARMPRGAFENNPRLYFRDLRAGKPLLY